MGCGRILAIDDEQNIRHLIQNEFALEGFEVTCAKNGEEGLMLFDGKKFDVVLLDVKLPKFNGIEVLKRLKQKSSTTQVIMITGYGDIKSAVDSIKLGARDYITKPFKLNELVALVKQAVNDQSEGDDFLNKTLRSAAEAAEQYVRCPSQAMQQVYHLAKRVAPTDNTVLIQGETGAGKDVLALQIHLESLRKDSSFVILDCGLISHHLAESELYGHRKGAFSGASEAKVGLVEQSHKGTLFLDEIGNIDLDLQKKFLRFLETRRFRRVGETRETRVDTRLILATNMDLQDAIQKGIMRKDLLYRMDVISIMVPPLRKRPEDVAPLARYFLQKYGNTGSAARKIAPDALNALSAYSWPGNVRELKSVICKALVLAESDTLTAEDLPGNIAVAQKVFCKQSKRLEDVEKEHIMAVLEETGGNQTQAAELLDINRKTLYKKIHKYKIFS